MLVLVRTLMGLSRRTLGLLVMEELTVVSYAWNFGDGTPAGSGVTTAHVYGIAGTFTVTLTVTDNAGLTGTASANVVVLAPFDCHFVHGKLSWTHHLSLAKNPAGQTFTAHLRCDTPRPEYVQVSVVGMNGVGASFSAMSPVTLVQPAVVTDITFSQFIDPASALANTKICFTASLYFGDTAATAMTNLSPITKSGCFAIVP